MNRIVGSKYYGLNLPVVGRKKIWGNLLVICSIFPNIFDNLYYKLYMQSFIFILEGNFSQVVKRNKLKT